MFEDQRCQFLALYLDNVVVFSSLVAQHLQWLEVVLSQLQSEGLKVKLKKYAFQQEIRYFVYLISKEGASTDPFNI